MPFTDSAGATPLVVAVDARTGVYLQSQVARTAQGNIFTLHDRAAAGRLVAGRAVQLPEPLGRLLVRPEVFCHHPTLVWKPCRESLSPFFPFHLFTIGDHRIYLRSDGALFTALHDTCRGI